MGREPTSHRGLDFKYVFNGHFRALGLILSPIELMLNMTVSNDSKCSTTTAIRRHGTAFADWPSDVLGRRAIGDKVR